MLEDDILRTVSGPGLAGYGGSIAAYSEGFAVACPGARSVALYGADGFRTQVGLAEACPLDYARGRLWVGGQPGAMVLEPKSDIPRFVDMPTLRLDNHWLVA